MKATEVTYIVEHHYGRAHLKATTEAEALESFARTKAKTKWGIKPTLVRETREFLAVKED